MKEHFTVALAPNQPNGQTAAQFPTGGFIANPAVEPRAEHVQLGFGHGAFESEQEPVIKQAGMIKAIFVADERVGHATQIQQAVPIGIVPGDAGNFDGEDQAGMAQRYLRNQVGEALAQDQTRSRVREILVDDFDPLRRPTQLPRAFLQLVLAFGGLAIDRDLRGGRLSNINEGPSLEMSGLNFGIIAHESCWRLEELAGRFDGEPV